jgi:hypothetical protein
MLDRHYLEQVPNWPGPQKPEGNRRDGLRGEERSDGAEGTANVGRALTVDVNGSVRCYDENACLLWQYAAVSVAYGRDRVLLLN